MNQDKRKHHSIKIAIISIVVLMIMVVMFIVLRFSNSEETKNLVFYGALMVAIPVFLFLKFHHPKTTPGATIFQQEDPQKRELVNYLKANLSSNEFQVFQDVTISSGHEMDLVILTPTEIFAINTRNEQGVVEFDGSNLTVNNSYFPDRNLLKNIYESSTKLKYHLYEETKQNINIKPFIVFSNELTELKLNFPEIQYVGVIHKKDLLSTISPKATASLFSSEIKNKLKEALEKITNKSSIF